MRRTNVKLAYRCCWITVTVVLKELAPKKKKFLGDDIILVTGAGHGLGRELSLRLAQHGATVVLWDIHEANVNKTATEIVANGGIAMAYVCDVTSAVAVATTAAKVREEVGDVTILINNAGVMQNLPFNELEPRMIRRTMDVNVLAHFWTTSEFVPKMQERNKGHIVAISSLVALAGGANYCDYCSSKHAVIGFMDSLSEEFRLNGQNIKTTIFCPCAMDTGMIQRPESKCPFILPILTHQKIAEYAIDAIQKEEFFVTIPHSINWLWKLLSVLPRKVSLEILDFIEYCRKPNKIQLVTVNGVAEK